VVLEGVVARQGDRGDLAGGARDRLGEPCVLRAVQRVAEVVEGLVDEGDARGSAHRRERIACPADVPRVEEQHAQQLPVVARVRGGREPTHAMPADDDAPPVDAVSRGDLVAPHERDRRRRAGGQRRPFAGGSGAQASRQAARR
jgi:hypothetical protein